jgi:hypothetical protein
VSPLAKAKAGTLTCSWCFGVIYLLARSHNNPQSLRQWLEHTDFVINATMEVVSVCGCAC